MNITIDYIVYSMILLVAIINQVGDQYPTNVQYCTGRQVRILLMLEWFYLKYLVGILTTDEDMINW